MNVEVVQKFVASKNVILSVLDETSDHAEKVGWITFDVMSINPLLISLFAAALSAIYLSRHLNIGLRNLRRRWELFIWGVESNAEITLTSLEQNNGCNTVKNQQYVNGTKSTSILQGTFMHPIREKEMSHQYLSPEEAFELAWSEIQISSYHKLVLPPHCRRVEAHDSNSKNKGSSMTKIITMFDYLAAMRMLSSKTVRFFVECVQAFFGYRRKKVHNANRRLDSLDEEDAEEITTSGADSMVAKSTPLSIATEGNATESEELVSTSQHEKNSKEIVNNKRGNRSSSGNNNRVSFAPSVSESMQNSDQIPNTNKSIVIPRQTTFLPQHTTPEGDSVKSEECQNFFDAAGTDFTMKQLQRDNPVPDKNGYILHTLGRDLSPLLVFVNSRSGLQQGHLIIAQLRRLLNPIQIFDLAEENPEKALESFSVLSKLRVLVCGGDGTVNWIISIMEKMNLEWWPPIAILPLGTGNDLSRIHDWGGGYNNKSLMLILQQVSEAYVSLLDRWAVTIEDTKGNIKNKKALTNYLGIGVDAQATLQVHNLRESKPTLFFSRIINKAWYLMFGAEDVFKASCADLPQQVTLVADGVNIPIPADSQGIVFLNIDSYGGGIPLWETGVKINRLSRRRSRYSESDFLSGDFFTMRRNSLDSGRLENTTRCAVFVERIL